MKNELYRLWFSKEMEKDIEAIEQIFNNKFKNDLEMTMEEWIDERMNEGKQTGILKGLNDKEKFLFILGMLSGVIADKYYGK